MQTILFVGAGGFLGAIARFLLSGWVQKSFESMFPMGTLFVNALGGLLIGFLALYFQAHIAPEYRALVITGFLGALTTFSTFSYETVMLLEHGAYVKAVANVVLSILITLLATMLGMFLYKRFFLL